MDKPVRNDNEEEDQSSEDDAKISSGGGQSSRSPFFRGDSDSESESEDEHKTGQESEEEENNQDDILEKSRQDKEIRKRDLLIAHLLRITSSSKEILRGGLVGLTKQLKAFGLVSADVAVFSKESSEGFYKLFGDVHRTNIELTFFPEFWVPMKTQYCMDFTELKSLGKGGYGRVMKCINKLDQREYAVKIIPLENNKEIISKETIGTDEQRREARIHSVMQHPHVVRYHHSWIGGESLGSESDQAESLESGSESLGSVESETPPKHIHCLYIQMELCGRSLSKHLERDYSLDEDFALCVSRQIVEGLAHIHEKGIVHRDLAPKNIFFDAIQDHIIKIGDFGLAKVLDEDDGKSTINSGKDGLLLYLAPESQPNSKITKKVDVYSFGIIFFELWHPFGSASERVETITKLKKEAIVPAKWEFDFPDHARLLRELVSTEPSLRPSAQEILTDQLFLY